MLLIAYSIVVLAIVGIFGFVGQSRSRKLMGIAGSVGVVVLLLFHWFGPSRPALAEQQETYRDFMSEMEHWVAIVESTATNYQAMEEIDSGNVQIFEYLARGAWNNMGNYTLSGRLEAENLERLQAIRTEFRAYANLHAEAYQSIRQLIETGQNDQVEEVEAQLHEANRHRSDAMAKAEELEAILQLR